MHIVLLGIVPYEGNILHATDNYIIVDNAIMLLPDGDPYYVEHTYWGIVCAACVYIHGTRVSFRVFDDSSQRYIQLLREVDPYEQVVVSSTIVPDWLGAPIRSYLSLAILHKNDNKVYVATGRELVMLQIEL